MGRGDDEVDPLNWTNSILLYSIVVAGLGISAYSYNHNKRQKEKNMFKCPNLVGKLAVVTGANTGVGAATVQELARAGASVIMGCRSLERGTAKAQEITSTLALHDQKQNKVVVYELDVSCPKSIANFASKIPDRIHILINNAGALIPERQAVHKDVELTVMTNHLGPALLTRLLLPKLIKTAVSEGSETRIINVSSRLEKTANVDKSDSKKVAAIVSQGPPLQQYTMWKAYSFSKLAMTAYTMEISRRLPSSQVVCNSVTPGMVNTELGRVAPLWLQYLSFPLRRYFLRTPEQGAESVLYAATSDDIRGISGAFIGDCQLIKPSKLASDPHFAHHIYEETERVLDQLSRNSFGGQFHYEGEEGNKGVNKGNVEKTWYGRPLY